MRRVLFRWRGLTVWSYPALLYVGAVTGIMFGNVWANAMGLDGLRVWLAMIVLFAIALVGSRLLYVAQHWETYRRDLGRIWDRNEGGAAQYGGFLAIVPCSWPLLAMLDVPFGAFWDVTAGTIMVGMIFTRVGCLLNGCCSGRPSEWFGVRLPNHNGVWRRRVPTQVLEGVLAAVLLVAAIALRPRFPFPGAVFLFVSGGYAAGRLLLESAREREADERAFTIHHVISIGIAVVSFGTLTILWPN